VSGNRASWQPQADGCKRRSPDLKLDNEPVIGALLGHILEVGEHLPPEVGKDKPLCEDLSPVLDDVGIVEMEAHWFLEKVAFGDEEVRMLG
jgi:hypothetical protein